MAGNPYSKFFWNDWQSDERLGMCSWAAQGYWMRMLCIMSKAQPYGHLAVDGNPISIKALSQLTGGEESVIAELIAELERNGVFSRRGHRKVIVCRRMIKEAEKSAAYAKNAGARWNKTGEKVASPKAADDDVANPQHQKFGKNSAKIRQKSSENAENPAAENANQINGIASIAMQIPCKRDANAHATPGTPLPVPKISKEESEKVSSISNPIHVLRPRARADKIDQGEESEPAETAAPQHDDPRKPIVPLRLQPARSAPSHKWRMFATSFEREAPSFRENCICGRTIIHLAVELFCQAARFENPDHRTDWSPLIRWLKDEIDFEDVILPTVKRMASYSNYTPPRSLNYFDRAVREAASGKKSYRRVYAEAGD